MKQHHKPQGPPPWKPPPEAYALFDKADQAGRGKLVESECPMVIATEEAGDNRVNEVIVFCGQTLRRGDAYYLARTIGWPGLTTRALTEKNVFTRVEQHQLTDLRDAELAIHELAGSPPF